VDEKGAEPYGQMGKEAKSELQQEPEPEQSPGSDCKNLPEGNEILQLKALFHAGVLNRANVSGKVAFVVVNKLPCVIRVSPAVHAGNSVHFGRALIIAARRQVHSGADDGDRLDPLLN
jgi:hypothetical protein